MQIPLSLRLGPCWELEEGSVDSTTFLQALPSAFPEATTAFFEGSSTASDSVDIFLQHGDSGPYLPQPQTLWSTGSILRFRCLFTPSLCEALASASLHCTWIASSIAEARVSAFAAILGLRYKYANHG
jgi:hypothetical protein